MSKGGIGSPSPEPTSMSDAALARWLRDAVESAGLAVWQVDLTNDGGTVACSLAYAWLLGLQADAHSPNALLSNPVPLADCRARIHPDDLERVRTSFRAAAADAEAMPQGADEGPPFQFTMRVVSRPGDGPPNNPLNAAGADDLVWIEAIGRFRRDPATGRAAWCSGIAFDVTARRQAEAAHRDEVIVRRGFVDGSPDALWVADSTTGTLEAASPAFTAVVGVSPARMLERYPFPWLDLVHPDDRRLLAGRREAAAQGAVLALDYRAFCTDESRAERWIRCSSFPLGTERPARRIGGILRDITAQKLAEAALIESEARLRLAQEAGGIGVYERDLVAGRAHWSAQMFQVWGLDPAGRSPWVDDADYTSLILPEDMEAHRSRRTAMRDDPAVSRFSTEYRIRRPDSGEVRWIASRGEYVRDSTGRAVLVRGTNHDITDRKRGEERQLLLMREVDHRAKNALAVVQAVLKLTRRDDPEAYARAVEGRIAALSRVQALLSEVRWTSADLRTLLEGELAPFLTDLARVTLSGPTVGLPSETVQPLAMAAHELATNALKHGALSVPGGRVSVSWHISPTADHPLELHWTETGGPQVQGPPVRQGFGTRVLDGTVRGQLGGTVSLNWNAEGLVCRLTVPLRHRSHL